MYIKKLSITQCSMSYYCPNVFAIREEWQSRYTQLIFDNLNTIYAVYM